MHNRLIYLKKNWIFFEKLSLESKKKTLLNKEKNDNFETFLPTVNKTKAELLYDF